MDGEDNSRSGANGCDVDVSFIDDSIDNLDFLNLDEGVGLTKDFRFGLACFGICVSDGGFCDADDVEGIENGDVVNPGFGGSIFVFVVLVARFGNFFDLDSQTDDFSEIIGKIIFTGRFLKNLKLMHEFGGGGGGGGFGGSEDAFATIGCNPSWNIK